MSAQPAFDASEWAETARQFWQQAADDQRSKWDELLTAWQKGVPGADTFKNFFADGGKQFLGLAQNFTNADPAEALKNWTAQMQDFFQSATQPDAANIFHTVSENMVKAGHAWAAAFADPRTHGHGPKGFQHFDPLGYVAAMPGIGYTREKQEEMSKLYRLWSVYNDLSNRYNAVMAELGLKAVAAFGAYINNPPEGAAPLTSLKGVYAKWVDVCEELYAQFAISGEYIELYGQTVNALMAFKQQFNKIADDMADELNLPTRKEIDALHSRMHDLRREVIALRQELAGKKKPAARKAKAKAAPVKKAAAPKPVAAPKPIKPAAKKPAAKKPAKKKGRK
jgi:polyhydroxyalkanoate synthase subunit PhaE